MTADFPKVVFATPECAPYIKTGGLADVSGSLPIVLAGLGIDVRILVPGYPAVLRAVKGARELALLPSEGVFPAAKILAAPPRHDVAVLVLDCPPLYDRPGDPYQDANGRDWEDSDIRFGLLSRVAATLGTDPGPLGWRADVVHCNDWQTGLAPVYLAHAPGRHAASVITVHNLAYQGIFPADRAQALGLPPESLSIDGLEYYGNLSFLKGGIAYADAVTTVSPTYAREICRAPLGFGLEGLIAARANVLRGILNGIDTKQWDPSADPRIPYRYGARTLERKRDNKLALQNAMGLALDPAAPVLGFVGRLVQQKGVDLLLEIAPRLIELQAQLAIQGIGEPRIQADLAALAQRHAGKIAVRLAFDEANAHLIEAGADIFLMPSRFEPCGMNQMYSQRYGTPPVVHATGGLADSVVDCKPSTLADGTATGFAFQNATAAEFLTAVRRALAAYRDFGLWTALQRSGMAKDFSWTASAAQYAEIYRRLARRG